jgi:hypothetical protein
MEVPPIFRSEAYLERQRQQLLTEMNEIADSMEKEYNFEKAQRYNDLSAEYNALFDAKPLVGAHGRFYGAHLKAAVTTTAKIAGGTAVGLAALLGGGYALYNYFSGGDMNPPGEAQPEDPAPNNAFMSPQVRTVIDKKLGVRKRPRKPRKASRRKKRV